MKIEECKEKSRVKFNGHKEEFGNIFSWNDTYIFVKFDEQVKRLGWMRPQRKLVIKRFDYC